MITITPPEIHPQSKGTLRIEATVPYDGSAGYPLHLSARATSGGTPLPWVPAALGVLTAPDAGGGPVSVTLAFTAPDPAAPLRLSSDGIDLQVTSASGLPLGQLQVPYIREWYRDLPAFRPADLARLPFGPDPLAAGTLRAAYDGDENGSLLFARPRTGGLLGLVVQTDAAPGPLTVLRWFDFGAPAPAGPRQARPGYVVAPGGTLDLAAGRVGGPAGGPPTPAADAVWEPAAEPGSPLQLRPLAGATFATLRTPILLALAATRVFARGNPRDGTTRAWDEIRDLFDNCDEVPQRAGFCVDSIWAPAGIEFRIVLRRDIRVQDNWAHELPATALRQFSQQYNLPGLLDVYFFRSVEGARAWGAPDRDPHALGQQGALWVGDRCLADRTPACWTADVITVAHEAGHFLTLTHRCDDTLDHQPCGPGDDRYLMYGDGTGPQSRLLTDDDVFRARQRAWAYRP